MKAYGRSEYAGLIDEKFVDKKVIIKGWVAKRRDLGNLIFVDIEIEWELFNVYFQKKKMKNFTNKQQQLEMNM